LNKKKLKIYFTDFWPNFRSEDNYFYNLLAIKYDLEIDSNNPDVLFHSVDYFNKEGHLKYNNGLTKKIFFTGENLDPVTVDTHFSLSFKQNSKQNYRLPLWTQYINWFEKDSNILDRDPAFLISKKSLLSSRKKFTSLKPYFCSFIASKPVGERVNFVPKLNEVKKVHNLGRLYTNSFIRASGRGDQKRKLTYMKPFKFNISFENSNSHGYVTEKILHSMYAGSIPIYWGSSQVKEDFNPDSFIFHGDFKNDSDLINFILETYDNKDLIANYLNEPFFKNNKIPDFVVPENVLTAISEFIDS
jgi:hypothetical protein